MRGVVNQDANDFGMILRMSVICLVRVGRTEPSRTILPISFHHVHPSSMGG